MDLSFRPDIRTVLSIDELHSLVAWIPPGPRTIEYRDSLIVSLLAELALRRHEVGRLAISSFGFVAGRPWVSVLGKGFGGKGPKRRTIPVPIPLYRRLVDHWEAFNLQPEAPAVWNFKHHSNPISGNQVGFIVPTRCHQLLGFRVRSHMIRHSVATAWIHLGVDIRTVQLLLGHADIGVTARYLHSSSDLLVDAVDSLQGGHYTRSQTALFPEFIRSAKGGAS